MPYVSLEKIIEDHKAEYYVALRTAQKDGKSHKAQVARWIHFFLDVMLRQVEVLQGSLDTSSSDALLSPNQKAALALFDKHEELSTSLVAKHLKIPAFATSPLQPQSMTDQLF